MKYFILLFICIFQLQLLVAQDTLMLHTGEKKVTTVTEINPTEIKYTRYGTETPLYIVSIKDVFWIKYKTGATDTISKLNMLTTNYPLQDDKLHLLHSRIYNAKGPLNENALWALIYSYPKPNVKEQLILKYKELSKQSKLQLTWFLLGLGSGYVSLYTVGFATEDNAVIPVAAVTVAACGSSIYFFINNRKKMRKTKNDIVTLYNSNL